MLIFFISPWVALLALAPLPLWTFYILRFSRSVQPAAKAVMEAEDGNVTLITENIAGVHVVKAFATEKQEIGKYSAISIRTSARYAGASGSLRISRRSFARSRQARI